MIQTEFVRTDQYYHAVINAPRADEREKRYLDYFIQPWATMLEAMTAYMSNVAEDPLAGARAWHWLLPDQLTEIPSALTILETENAWERGAEAMQATAAHFQDYAERLGIEKIVGWLILADPATSDPIMRGYTGGIDWMQPRFIAQFDTPNDDNLSKLEGLIAHEMHHLFRMRAVPYNFMQITVAEYIVLEGLAEAFAAAIYGESAITFFATEISDDDLRYAKSIMQAGLWETGWQVVRSYLFGDYWAEQFGLIKVGMPTYGGYAVGYQVVRAFLERTGTDIVAATFLPADEIVKASGYFA